MSHDPKLGETLRIAVQFTDHAGQPFAASGASITARRPDGTTVVGAIASDADIVGKFTATFLADTVGTWLIKAECTGPLVVRDEKTFSVSRLRWDMA